MRVEEEGVIGEGKQRGSNSLLSLVVIVVLPFLLPGVAQMCRGSRVEWGSGGVVEGARWHAGQKS